MKVLEALTKNSRQILFVILPLLSFLLHIHIFPKELNGVHAWRQTETASNVINFAEKDFNITRPHVFSLEWPDGLKRMEFPVMQWGMALFFKAFGESVFILRILSFLLGLVAIWGIYLLVKYIFQSKLMALLGAWCFTFSPLFFYYTVNPMPDNLALASAILGMAWFFKWYREEGKYDLWICSAFLMLATLAKLPFVLFYAIPLGFALIDTIRWKFRRLNRNLLHVALPALVSLVAPAIWYLSVIPEWKGNGVVGGITSATAEDFPEILHILQHTLVSTLPELIINYASLGFFLVGIYFMFRNSMRKRLLYPVFALWAAGIGLYFIFEINLIGTEHDYYLFPFLPGIFLIVAYGAYQLYMTKNRWARIYVYLALLMLPVTACLRTYDRWDKGIPTDLIEYRAELRAAVPDDAKVIVGHDRSPHIFLYHLHKQGWSFQKDALWLDKVQRCIDEGAEYLYSSTREIDQDPGMQAFLDELVFEKGTFRVYRLRRVLMGAVQPWRL